MMVEFYGLPGVGKTSVVNQLRLIGNSSNDFTYLNKAKGGHAQLFRERRNLNKTRKIIEVIRLSFALSRILIILSIISLRGNKESWAISKEILLLIIKGQLKGLKTDKPIIVLDEGFIQFCASLYLTTSIRKFWFYRFLIQEILRFNKKLKCVFFSIEPEVSFSRIQSRGDGRSRFDYLKEEQAIAMLKDMSVFFFEVSDYLKLNKNQVLVLQDFPLDEKVNRINNWLLELKYD